MVSVDSSSDLDTDSRAMKLLFFSVALIAFPLGCGAPTPNADVTIADVTSAEAGTVRDAGTPTDVPADNGQPLLAGTYRTTPQRVLVLVDSCNVPRVTSDDFAGFTLQVETMNGMTTVAVINGVGTTILTGPLDGMSGFLDGSGVIQSGPCVFQQAERANVSVGVDGSISVTVMSDRSMFRSAPGMDCPRPVDCAIAWRSVFTRG